MAEPQYGWPANTPKTAGKADDDDRDQPRIINCKWCPVQITYNGRQWVHVDGGSCQSHQHHGTGMPIEIQLATKLAGDPT